MSVYFLEKLMGYVLGFCFVLFFASNVKVIVFFKKLIPVYGKV